MTAKNEVFKSVYETDESGVTVVVKGVPGHEVDERGELEPRVIDVLTEQQKKPHSDQVFSIEDMRAQMGWDNTDLTTTNVQTEEVTIDGRNGPVLVRVYKPESSQPLSVIVFFHGGGFIGGTLDVVENPCKYLAEQAESVVVSVDYRLAPEHPFPQGLHDCMDAVHWAQGQMSAWNIQSTHLAVAGDSAGGNLATVCARLDRESKANQIGSQILIYPTVNTAQKTTGDFKWTIDAYDTMKHKELILPGIDGLKSSAALLNNLYLQGETSPEHPHVSPLLADDVTAMPPALIVTAEFDYLRLEAEAYGKKVSKSGVPVTVMQYKGVDHAFLDKLGLYPQAQDCIEEAAAFIKKQI